MLAEKNHNFYASNLIFDTQQRFFIIELKHYLVYNEYITEILAEILKVTVHSYINTIYSVTLIQKFNAYHASMLNQNLYLDYKGEKYFKEEMCFRNLLFSILNLRIGYLSASFQGIQLMRFIVLLCGFDILLICLAKGLYRVFQLGSFDAFRKLGTTYNRHCSFLFVKSQSFHLRDHFSFDIHCRIIMDLVRLQVKCMQTFQNHLIYPLIHWLVQYRSPQFHALFFYTLS